MNLQFFFLVKTAAVVAREQLGATNRKDQCCNQIDLVFHEAAKLVMPIEFALFITLPGCCPRSVRLYPPSVGRKSHVCVQ